MLFIEIPKTFQNPILLNPKDFFLKIGLITPTLICHSELDLEIVWE
jgi:hypothetical protein